MSDDCPFVEGTLYVVIQEDTLSVSDIVVDERVRFVRENYSRYDSASVYLFQTEDGSAWRSWWRYSDTPISKWKEYFAEIDDG